MARNLKGVFAAGYCTVLAAAFISIASNNATKAQVVAACEIIGGCVNPTATAQAVADYQAQSQLIQVAAVSR
jgi:hypothetical protein